MAEQIENKVKNVARPDWIGNSKTIYDVPAGEVFWRNFVAGMGRALGGVLMYFVFVYVIYSLFVNFLLPVVSPYLEGYMDALNLFTSSDEVQTGQGGAQPNQQQINNFLQQFGQTTR